MEIVVLRDYLLDGKLQVKVVKALNRAKTVFCVESGSGLQTVEKGRLTAIEKEEENRGVGILGVETKNSVASALRYATDDNCDNERLRAADNRRIMIEFRTWH